MSESRKHPVIKRLIIFLIIVIVIIAAAYIIIPKLFVKAMMSDSIRKKMPANVTRLVNRSGKEINRGLRTLKLTPEQAKDEIDEISFSDIERVVQGIKGKGPMSREEFYQLITKEIDFKHVNPERFKRYIPARIPQKDIKHFNEIFEENKTKYRLMFPAVKSMAKQMIDEKVK